MNQGPMNGNQISNQPSQPQKMPLEYILYICLALAVIGCFLPFATFSESLLGTKATTNYIMYDDSLKDGVFIIAIAAAAFFAIFKKKNYKAVLVLLVIGIGITIFDVVDIKTSFDETVSASPYLKEYMSYNYEIGAFVVLISLVVALVITFILNSKNKNINPVPVVPQPVMNNQVNMNNVMNQPVDNGFIQQPVIKCQYCGSDKNDGMYCKNCGGKY